MKRTITILLGLICIVLFCISVFLVISVDNNAPEFSIIKPELVYVEDSDESELLEAVKATDKVDGDVSSNIKIEKKAVSDDKTSIRVQYVVKDNSNNISKTTVTYGFSPAPNKPVETPKRTYNIALVNNLGIENLANAYATVLREKGHRIVSIGLSTDPPAVETVIYVTNAGTGEELLEIFPNSSIIVGNISNRINVDTTGADAFVILGYQHSLVPKP